MFLKRLEFGTSDQLFLYLKNFLRNDSSAQSIHGETAVYDDYLRSLLSEFQQRKALTTTDGSLNLETFHALGEQLSEEQLLAVVFRNPKLKSLFVSGKNSHKFALQPGVVMVALNIVYDPNLLPSDARGKNALQFVKDSFKPKLDYWEETFRKLHLGYTVDFTVGTTNNYRDRIMSGAKDGYVNIFFLDDGRRRLGAYGVFFPDSRHIFISEQANDKMYRRTLCHELIHFFGITSMTGFRLIDFFLPSNIISDARINWALRQLKSNFVRYGFDWVDDWRAAYTELPTPRGYEFSQRVPTIYDIIRVGALLLRERKK